MDLYAQSGRREFIGTVSGDDKSGYSYLAFGGSEVKGGFKTWNDAAAALVQDSGVSQFWIGDQGPNQVSSTGVSQ